MTLLTAMLDFVPEGTHIHPMVRIGRHAAEGIVEAALGEGRNDLPIGPADLQSRLDQTRLEPRRHRLPEDDLRRRLHVGALQQRKQRPQRA